METLPAITDMVVTEVKGEGVELNEMEQVSLCEALDRILNKGAVVVGEVMISVANIDLLYLGLQLILTSIDTARELRSTTPARTAREVA